MSFFQKPFDKQILWLDGGLGTDLESLGCDISNALWSGSVLLHDSEKIFKSHSRFLNAGSNVLITSSYHLSFLKLKEMGFENEKIESILLKSIELAKNAIQKFRESKGNSEKTLLIAASIGPFAIYFADGSEYNGNYKKTCFENLIDFHREKFILFSKHKDVDIVAFETIPNFLELKAILKLIQTIDIGVGSGRRNPCWISFCCRNENELSDGTSMKTVFETVRDAKLGSKLAAIGVNCTAPQYISNLIELIRIVFENEIELNRPAIVVYPNSGEIYNGETFAWSGDAMNLDNVKQWRAQGAQLIGGCCRVTPQHIKQMIEAVEND